MIRVLVVDDDKLVRKGLISAMPWEACGMEVVGEASQGLKALEFMEAHPVDLLLTDLAMPVMTGIELIREVRKRGIDVHIAVLTLHQDFEYIQEALRLGAIDYIAKVQLETERFDEVLRRIAGRIGERHGSGKEGIASPGTEEALRPDRGAAFVTLLPDADAGWLRELLPEKLQPALQEIERGLWVWLPAEGEHESRSGRTDGMLRLGFPMDRTRNRNEDIPFPAPGWALLELSGLRECSAGQLQRALREYKDRSLFYDMREDGRLGVFSPAGWMASGPEAPEAAGSGLPAASWLSPEWIHSPALCGALKERLAQTRIPPAELYALLYTLAASWNRFYHEVAGVEIRPPAAMVYRYQGLQWLDDTSAEVRQAMGRSAYSAGVVEAVMKSVHLLHEELGGEMTAQDAARRVHMSRSYFSECFRNIVGCTFNEYLRKTRMAKAEEYLLHTDKPVQWIAEKTGYLDEKYFRRTFREVTGLLPSEYRLSRREGGEVSPGKGDK
ncbi:MULTISPECIES: response regulator [Paenibacillus]|uniref:response regulator n=1 Tax=Paenibacillus TaxID=44249 RepID=UPI0022B884AF|nr:response regulator [Paenibacillus caseinilyticus]MCZ8521642.1 response regulator [Paenibacillus caseinilyticus]